MNLRNTAFFLIILGLSLALGGCNSKFLNIELVGSAPSVNNGTIGFGGGCDSRDRAWATHYRPMGSCGEAGACEPGFYDCSRPGYCNPGYAGARQPL